MVGRRLNPLDPHDNATTGVVLLKILKQSASNERQAIAAYYQGLRSVRERGMYPDTRPLRRQRARAQGALPLGGHRASEAGPGQSPP